MSRRVLLLSLSVAVLFTVSALFFEGRAQERRAPDKAAGKREPSGPEQDALKMIKEGRQTFRYDTFGDEEFWGDALQLHRAIAGEKLGGVGPGVSPKTALAVGLKVDAEALPKELVQKIEKNQVDLNDPATTLALLKLDAVVGVKGFLEADNKLRSVGITCAICHSTVDDSFARGIGKRLDGWPNASSILARSSLWLRI